MMPGSNSSWSPVNCITVITNKGVITTGWVYYNGHFLTDNIRLLKITCCRSISLKSCTNGMIHLNLSHIYFIKQCSTRSQKIDVNIMAARVPHYNLRLTKVEYYTCDIKPIIEGHSDQSSVSLQLAWDYLGTDDFSSLLMNWVCPGLNCLSMLKLPLKCAALSST